MVSYSAKIELKTIAYCTDHVDSVPVIISIIICKSFTKPTKAKGYILFNGIRYDDMIGLGVSVYKSKSFWENIRMKADDFQYHYFINSALRLQKMEWFNRYSSNFFDFKEFALIKETHMYYIN